jgi:hypothetical protein
MPFVVPTSYEEMAFARLTGGDMQKKYREVVAESLEALKEAEERNTILKACSRMRIQSQSLKTWRVHPRRQQH